MDETIQDPAVLLQEEATTPPHLAEAYRFWLDAKAEEALPHRRFIDPTCMPVSILRWVAVLEPIEEDQDFLIRLVGSGVSAALKTNVTNVRASTLQRVEVPVERLRWSVRNKQPYVTHHPLTWVKDRDFIDYNVLVLPFANGGGEVARLLLVFSFDFSTSTQQ